MTRFRRGFKSEAAEIGEITRGEIGLGPLDPLDPFLLAKHLSLSVVPMTSLVDSVPESVDYFSGPGSSEFSAMIVFVGTKRTILYNDLHAPTRQMSDLCHEIAHALLLHEPFRDGEQVRHDPIQEAEAHWLGGVLLVSDQACLTMCRRGARVDEAARWMGVSQDLLRWRLNASGALIRVRREGGTRRQVSGRA